MRTSTLTIALGLGLVAGAPAQAPREMLRINTNGSNPSSSNANNGRSIAQLGKTWLIAYADQNGTTDATEDIYASVSTDGGVTWSTPARVDVGDGANTTDSNLPKCYVLDDPQNPGSVIFGCVWEDSRLQPTSTGNGACDDVFAAWSTDGVNWSLSTTTVGPGMGVLNPGFGGCTGTGMDEQEVDEITAYAADGIIHVVYEEDGVNPGCAFGSESVYYTRSTDGGRSFEPVQRLNMLNSTTACDVGILNDIDNPYVHADQNLVVVTWCDDFFAPGVEDDVWIAVSLDGGFTFLPATPIELGGMMASDVGDVDDTYVYVEGRNVFVYYQDDEFHSADAPVAMLSTDGGMTFGNEISLSPMTVATVAAGVTYMDAVITGNSIYFAYCSDFDAVNLTGAQPSNASNSATRQLYVSYSHDLGLNWVTDVDLDPGRANQECQIGASGQRVAVAAQLNPFGTNSMSYWVSSNGGATFSAQPVTSSQSGDIDQADNRAGRHFAFDGPRFTGNSVAAWNFTGQNEQFRCGVRSPGLYFGTPAPGQQAFFITGAEAPTNTKIWGLFFSASGLSPATVIDGQCLNFVIDGVTLATLGIFTGTIGPGGSASSGAFPALTSTLGLWGVVAVIDVATSQILFSDSLAF